MATVPKKTEADDTQACRGLVVGGVVGPGGGYSDPR